MSIGKLRPALPCALSVILLAVFHDPTEAQRRVDRFGEPSMTSPVPAAADTTALGTIARSTGMGALAGAGIGAGAGAVGFVVGGIICLIVDALSYDDSCSWSDVLPYFFIPVAVGAGAGTLVGLVIGVTRIR